MQLNLWLIVALFLVLAAFGSVVFGRKPVAGLKVMSWNIRYDNPADGVHRWENRKERVLQFLRQQNSDVIGLQEVLHHQLNTLKSATADRYSWLGVGRDDGQTAGEYSPIAYNHHRLELLQYGVLWLSETPGQPSVGWDAHLPRICSWAKFLHKEKNTEFWVFNTHFDHAGETARRESARLLADSIQSWTNDQAVILMGDFNEGPEGAVLRTILLSGLQDSRLHADQSSGSTATFHGFTEKDPRSKRIDFVFYRKWRGVSNYFVPLLADEKGHFASDHAPVVVTLTW